MSALSWHANWPLCRFPTIRYIGRFADEPNTFAKVMPGGGRWKGNERGFSTLVHLSSRLNSLSWLTTSSPFSSFSLSLSKRGKRIKSRDRKRIFVAVESLAARCISSPDFWGSKKSCLRAPGVTVYTRGDTERLFRERRWWEFRPPDLFLAAYNLGRSQKRGWRNEKNVVVSRYIICVSRELFFWYLWKSLAYSSNKRCAIRFHDSVARILLRIDVLIFDTFRFENFTFETQGK